MAPLPRSRARRVLQVWSRAELLEAGMSRGHLDRRVEGGILRKLGRSWYGLAGTPTVAAGILSSGRRLTCADALDLAGVWTPPTGPGHAVGLRSAVPSPHGYVRRWPDGEPVMPLSLALRHAAACLSVEGLAASLESVAHQGLLDTTDVDAVLGSLPVGLQDALGDIDPRAESGTETRVRRALHRSGHRVVPQVMIDGVGRVDLLVEDRIVIECDSRAHHTAPEAYAEDRRRDLELVSHGYVVIRLTWEDVWLRWDGTRARLDTAITEALRRRRRPLRTTPPLPISPRTLP